MKTIFNIVTRDEQGEASVYRKLRDMPVPHARMNILFASENGLLWRRYSIRAVTFVHGADHYVVMLTGTTEDDEHVLLIELGFIKSTEGETL